MEDTVERTTVNFLFKAGDEVRIKGTGEEGVICMSSFDGTSAYQVLLPGGTLMTLPEAVFIKIN